MIRFLKHEEPMVTKLYFGTKTWVVTHGIAENIVAQYLLTGMAQIMNRTIPEPLTADMSIEWTAEGTVKDKGCAHALRQFVQTAGPIQESGEFTNAIQCHILRNIGLNKAESKLYGEVSGPWTNAEQTFFVMPYKFKGEANERSK
jgi:hypothetical protein